MTVRVLVPRAGEPGDRLAVALTDAGFQPLVVPLIAFDPPADAGPFEAGLRRVAAGAFNWLVLTSERTVDAIQAHWPGSPGELGARALVAVVGPSTARRAAEAGIFADVIPTWEKSARGLIAALTTPGAGQPPQATTTTAFVPHSNIARPELGTGLRAAGWHVTEVEAYRTITAHALPPEARDADVVLLTSSSTATTWARLRAAEHDPLYVSIGPRTTETAADLGLPIAATAPEPTSESLINTLTTLTTLTHLLPTARRSR